MNTDLIAWMRQSLDDYILANGRFPEGFILGTSECQDFTVWVNSKPLIHDPSITTCSFDGVPIYFSSLLSMRSLALPFEEAVSYQKRNRPALGPAILMSGRYGRPPMHKEIKNIEKLQRKFSKSKLKTEPK